MSGRAKQFPFVPRDPAIGAASLAPLLPLTLVGQQSVEVSALLDSGATVNVLPQAVGEQLGFRWEQQTTTVVLTGNLASVEARAIVVAGIVADFTPVRLAFAWAKSNTFPVILGQVNFFLEFDVCFYRSRGHFDVRPKQSP